MSQQFSRSYVAKHRQAASSLRRLLTAVSTLLLMMASACAAQENQSAGAGLRRVFVPRDQPESWPTDNQRFVPLKKSELIRLTEAQLAPKAEALVEQATLIARVDAQGKLIGHGELRIDSQGSGVAFLDWAIAPGLVTKAVWRDLPTRPVLLGTWPVDSGGEYRRGLSVPYAGTLDFEFQVAPTALDRSEQYTIALPNCLRRQLQVTLPEGMTPRVGGALLKKSSSDRNTWVIRPAYESPLRFSLTDLKHTTSITEPDNGVSISTEALLSPRGAELRCHLRIRGAKTPVRTLSVELPEAVSILSVTAAGEPVTWRTTLDDSGSRLLQLDLSSDRLVASSSLLIRSWCDVQTQEPWTIPQIVVRDMTWEGGNIALHVAPEFSMDDIPIARGAVLKSVSSLTPDGSEVYRFDCFRQVAEVAVVVTASDESPSLSILQSCELRRNEAASMVEITFDPTSFANTQLITAALSPGWLIESVDSPSKGLVKDWFLEAPPESASANSAGLSPADTTGQAPRLRVRLNNVQLSSVAEASPDRTNSSRSEFADHRLRIACRRLVPSNQENSLASLCPLRFEEGVVRSNLLEVAARVPHQLQTQFASKGSSRFILDQQAQSLRVDANEDSAAASLRSSMVSLRLRPLSIDARIALLVDVADQSFEFESEIVISGETGQAESIPCLFQSPLPGRPLWIDANTGQRLDATRAAPQRQVRSGTVEELWLIQPPAQGTSPFRLKMVTTAAADDDFSIPLAMVPSAREQSGELTLSARSTRDYVFDHSDLIAVMSPAEDEIAYRYDPLSVSDPRRAPRLRLQRADTQRRRSAPRASLLCLDTYWMPDRPTRHTATYKLLDSGHFEFRLPEHTKLLSITDREGRQLEAEAADNATSDGWLLCRTDSVASKSDISIAYCQIESSGSTQVLPQLPESVASRSSWEWRLWTPQDWATDTSEAIAPSLRRRLLGPLSAASPQPPFNPLRQADWQALLKSIKSLVLPEEGSASIDRSLPSPPTAATFAGWRSHRTLGSSTLPQALRVVQVSRHQAGFLAIQLLVMAVAAWVLSRWPHRYFLLLLVTMGVTLAAPTSLSAWFSAMWFGTAMAAPWRWLTRVVCSPVGAKRSSDAASIGAHSQLGKPRSVAWLLAVIGPALLSGLSAAKAASPERLLIPVDAAGRQLGDKVYLSEAYWQQILEKEARRQAPGPSSVLLRHVSIHGELTDIVDGAPIELSPWTVALELEVFHRDARVHLPLERRAGDWPTSVDIDGVPAALEWDRAGASFVVPEPGPCVVSMMFKPVVVVEEGKYRLHLRGLADAGGTLSLNYPKSIADVRVLPATNVRKSAPGKLVAVLDGRQDLSLSWSDTQQSQPRPSSSVEILQRVELAENGLAMSVLAATNGQRKPVRFTTPPAGRT